MATLQYDRDMQQLDFLHICSLGDVGRVRDALLTGRVDIQYRHKSNGWTALHWAASRGHYEVALLLIEAGFAINTEDSQHRVPYDVCPKDQGKLLEVLQLGEEREEMVQNNAGRRTSDVSDQSSPGFVPNYVRNPPFPYAMKNSFDNFSSPASSASNGPGSPGPLNSPTYSYGRRDSLQKTRFLLVRTSVEKGKETYKRVTLPGGSDVERLKSTIEKACKGRLVDMIFTLPENDLVESIEQIQRFKDCQKIDVIFKDNDRQTTPPVTGDDSAAVKMSEEREVSPKELVVEKDYGQDDIEIPKSDEHEEEEVRAPTPPEDLSRFVKEPSPPVSLAATDLDSNNGTDEGNGNGDEPKLIPLATRQSLDSDPGDFEKVDKEEAAKLADPSPAVAGLAAAIPIISAQVEEEHKNPTAEPAQEHTFVPAAPEPAHVAPSSKATIVEESKQIPEDRESSDLATWIHNNPTVVRNVATAAAVAGVAGLGYYVYVKKFK